MPIPLFPSVQWFQCAQQVNVKIVKGGYLYNKSYPTNKVYLLGANGLQMFSFPIMGGRSTKCSVETLPLFEFDKHAQHFLKILMSNYGNAPFYFHYGPELAQLIQQPYQSIAALHIAVLNWCCDKLKMVRFQLWDATIVDGQFMSTHDWKKLMTPAEPCDAGAYAQLFEEKNGFIGNVSILDVLMLEGPLASQYLRAS